MLNMFKDGRWQSPVLWTSLIAQIVALLLLFKVIDLQMGETINIAAGMIAQMLVTVGIFNNPTDKENW